MTRSNLTLEFYETVNEYRVLYQAKLARLKGSKGITASMLPGHRESKKRTLNKLVAKGCLSKLNQYRHTGKWNRLYSITDFGQVRWKYLLRRGFAEWKMVQLMRA